MRQIPWDVPAVMIANRHRPVCGSLFDCVLQWMDMPHVFRKTAFIRLDRSLPDMSVIGASAIGNLAESGDFTARLVAKNI